MNLFQPSDLRYIKGLHSKQQNTTIKFNNIKFTQFLLWFINYLDSFDKAFEHLIVILKDISK